jgi:hypothetical protein
MKLPNEPGDIIENKEPQSESVVPDALERYIRNADDPEAILATVVGALREFPAVWEEVLSALDPADVAMLTRTVK